MFYQRECVGGGPTSDLDTLVLCRQCDAPGSVQLAQHSSPGNRGITDRFKLNDGNGFPGQSPRRFGEPDREILHVFYECLRTPHPTGCICLFFVCLTFSRLRFLGNLNLIRPNDFGDKQKAGQASGNTRRAHVESFRVYLSKTA